MVWFVREMRMGTRPVTAVEVRPGRLTIRSGSGRQAGYQVIAAGEFDLSNREHLAAALRTALTSGGVLVEVDLGAVTFMDASIVGVLLRSRKLAAEHRCALTVVNATGLPARILNLTDTTDILCSPHPRAGHVAGERPARRLSTPTPSRVGA